ncbi:hypothetical protein PR048_023878 [Dryococelus australis]|uniref:Uncharacterized protein n=1 Tax=Dryococelus australis TaxID=614101 RepID=A0ABQ9GVB3_9NEOP|nr:hypothetical protein PR048_023878 [Dryococelus australis]
MRVTEVSMEQRWNERAGKTRDPRENPPTNGIVRYGARETVPTNNMREVIQTAASRQPFTRVSAWQTTRHGGRLLVVPLQTRVCLYAAVRVLQISGAPCSPSLAPRAAPSVHCLRVRELACRLWPPELRAPPRRGFHPFCCQAGSLKSHLPSAAGRRPNPSQTFSCRQHPRQLLPFAQPRSVESSGLPSRRLMKIRCLGMLQAVQGPRWLSGSHARLPPKRTGFNPRRESCRTMTLVGGLSRGSPVSPTSSFRRRSTLTSVAIVGSQYLAVKSRPNRFTHSLVQLLVVRAVLPRVTAVFATLRLTVEKAHHANKPSVPLRGLDDFRKRALLEELAGLIKVASKTMLAVCSERSCHDRATQARLYNPMYCTNTPMSTVHWLSAVTLQGDDWATLLQEVPNTCFDETNFSVNLDVPTDNLYLRIVYRLAVTKFNATRGLKPQFTLGDSGGIAPGITHVIIVPDDAAGWRVFSGISCPPKPFIPALLHTHLTSSSSALKTLILRVAQLSSHTRPIYKITID